MLGVPQKHWKIALTYGYEEKNIHTYIKSYRKCAQLAWNLGFSQMFLDLATDRVIGYKGGIQYILEDVSNSDPMNVWAEVFQRLDLQFNHPDVWQKIQRKNIEKPMQIIQYIIQAFRNGQWKDDSDPWKEDELYWAKQTMASSGPWDKIPQRIIKRTITIVDEVI